MAKKSKNSKLLVHYTRTITPENLSRAANYVGGYVLKGLGALGKIFTAPLTGGPLGPATVVLPKTKELLDAERKLRETQEELIGKAMTWVSPLNYGAALATGNGLNARKGEEEVASWSPAWLAAARLGELYVGPKAVKGVKAAPKVVVNTAAKAGVKPAKAAVVAREINKGVKENKPNVSNRTVSTDRTVNGITGLPDILYTLYNEFGEPIGQTNVGGATLGIVDRTSKTSNRMVDGIYSKNKAHKVSEDTYNVAIEDILNNGGIGLESGWSLMSPLKTMAVTSKFPYTVIGQEFGNPVRLLTGNTKRAIPQRVLGNHYLEIKPKTEIKFNEVTGEFEEIPIEEFVLEPSTSLKFFERKPSKISEAEKAGVPKGERNNINNSGNLERTVNDIILENGYSLPKETGMFAQKHSSVGSNYRKTFERLWGKENTDRLTDDLLGKLILIRNHLIDTNIPLKGDFVYVVDGQAKAYRNGLEIGYLNNSYIDNGKALHPEMVKKQGTNNAGVSELLYNGTILAENRPIISGSRLLMPEVTTHIWSKYPTRKLISTEGVHAWPLRTAQERGIKLNYEKNWHTLPEFSKLHQLALDENIRTDLTGLPIYELSEPSYLPMVKNARVFDISLLRDGYINLDFTPGFAYKQGGKINAIKQFKQGGQVRKMLTASGGPIYWLRKKLYNNIEPFGYNDVGSRLYNGIILNKNEHNNFKGDYSDPEKAPALYLTIDNIWGEYLHIPEKERRYSNGKYKIKNNGNGTFSLPFESMEDIMQVVNSSNNPLLWGLRGKLGNSVVGEYDVHRGYDKNGDYLKYIDHWRINPYDVKENKEYGLDDNSILKWYFKGKDDASFGLGTPVEIQGKYYLDDIYNVKGKDRGGHYLPEIIVTGKKKQGGKMNVLEFLKNGSGIHIKEKNKGKFTSYCGGKVTDECILKGKNSSNPAIRKRATFAANARKWKHKEGGIIKAADGTKTNFGLKVSNALGKVGNFLNSDLGSNLVNIGTSVVGGIAQNNVINKQIEANNEDREVNKQEAVLKRYLELKAEKRKKNKSYFDNNGNIINESPITSDSEAWNEALKTTDTSGIDDYYNKSNIALSYAKNSNNWDMLGSIGGLSSSILNSFGNKKDSNSSNNNYFGNYVKTLYKNQGTFNSDGSMNLGHGLGTFSTTGGYKPQQYQMKTYTPLLKFSL